MLLGLQTQKPEEGLDGEERILNVIEFSWRYSRCGYCLNEAYSSFLQYY